ncbi:MAG: hypothetical protein V1821_03180 [bacterium]
MSINSSRKDLVRDLLSYEEKETADWVKIASRSDLLRIIDRSGYHARRVNFLSKALALAAVEIREGKPRELSKKRRNLVLAEKTLGEHKWEALDEKIIF